MKKNKIPNLNKLRKTANHLMFLRSVQRTVGERGGIRLITASGDRYTTMVEVRQHIQHCKKRLKMGIRR